MSLICFRCGYIAASKSKLIEHFCRKNVCEATRQNISVENVYAHYKEVWGKKKIYKCDFCELESPKNDSAFRSHKYRCKTKVMQSAIDSYQYEFEGKHYNLTEKYDFACKKIELLEKEVEKLKNKPNIINNNTTVNNYSNCHIFINTLGEEDLDHLSNNQDFRKKLNAIATHYILCWDALPYFIQNVHYGNDKNKNINVDNPNDEYASYLKNNEWIIAKKTELFDKIAMEEWAKMPQFLSENTLNHRHYKKVDENLQTNVDYKQYVKSQINIVVSNKGNVNVFDNTGNETAKFNKINEEFLLK
jgi:hypothetical protein